MIIKKILLLFVKIYQILVSPAFGPTCRFYPTCSEYAYQAILRYGSIKGTYLSLRRIIRCNPFHPGGVDNIP